MADLGTDTSTPAGSDGLPGLDPAFRVVSGRTALAQALLRRLTTPRGTLVGDTGYGCDVRAWANDTLSAGDLRRLEARVADELRADERVDDVAVVVTFAAEVLRIVARVRPVDGSTSLRLTLAVSAITAELLSAEAA